MTGRAGWIGAVAPLLGGGRTLWPLAGQCGEPTVWVLLAPVAQVGNSLMANQEALANLYSTALPSVVNIQVTSRVTALPGFGLPDGEGNAPLEQSLGSGFIYDDHRTYCHQ